MKIEIIGAHNAETDRTRMPCLLVDDVIALDAGGLTAGLPLERQQRIRALFLTHHHFDHTRDLITLGANDTNPPSTVDVYGLSETLQVVYNYLLDGRLYKDFTQWPKIESPRLLLKPVAPFQQIVLASHTIVPVPVSHTAPSVGFLVTSRKGKSFFYTGDTGPGLKPCWEQVSPDVLFIEVTGLNSMVAEMSRLKHLVPQTLVEELKQFRKMKGYIPRVITTHVPMLWEDKLKAELEAAGKELGARLEVGYEGLVVKL